MITERDIHHHFLRLSGALDGTEVTDIEGEPISLSEGFNRLMQSLRGMERNKAIFIGNGGSAGIASHFAIDYSKNGGMRAIALNDPVAITCAGNDYGYENGFAGLLNLYADVGDILVAISSSGKSPNILNAVRVARELNCAVYTFSGFRDDNPLRQLGDVNFYVGAQEYGFVEVSHMALLHSVLDLAMGGA